MPASSTYYRRGIVYAAENPRGTPDYREADRHIGEAWLLVKRSEGRMSETCDLVIIGSLPAL